MKNYALSDRSFRTRPWCWAYRYFDVSYTVDYWANTGNLAKIYQSSSVRYMITQQPTSDKRDEQWVLGYGLFVNTLVYSYLGIQGEDNRAAKILKEMKRFSLPRRLFINIFMKGSLWKTSPTMTYGHTKNIVVSHLICSVIVWLFYMVLRQYL